MFRPNGVIAFMLDRDGAVVLVEQYRPPLGRVALEMPAGSVDKGETLETAVIREVLEKRAWFDPLPPRPSAGRCGRPCLCGFANRCCHR